MKGPSLKTAFAAAIMAIAMLASPFNASGLPVTLTVTPVAGIAPGYGTITISFIDTTGKSYLTTVPYGPLSNSRAVASAFGAQFAKNYLCPSGACGSGLGAQGTNGPGDSGLIALQLNSLAAFGQISVTSTGPMPFSITVPPPPATNAAPIINSASPNPAEAGSSVTVSGSGFGASQGAGSLSLNGSIVTPLTWSDSSITFDLPADATSGPLTVSQGSAASDPVILNVGLPYASFYQVNPFALSDSDSAPMVTLSYAAVLAALAADRARGIVADGTSTSIIVYRTNVPETLTLSVDGTSGALLQAWNPGFLTSFGTSVPALSISIPARNLSWNPVAKEYSALALLKAPSPPFTGQIVVTANQTTLTGQTSAITAIPRPVIMVHGLWSDSSAFQNVSAALTPNNSPYVDITAGSTYSPTLLAPIYRACYSGLLAFDAPSDVDLGNCDWPSEDAINAALSEVYSYLDSEQIVGGRVDVLGHSMGGLSARHFATTSRYFGNRDLQQGKFYSTFTIDTPHLGSALAPYLLSVADNTYVGDDAAGRDGRALWTLLVSCSASDSLATCLETLGKSVGDTVASLDPAYPGISDPTANPRVIPGTVQGLFGSQYIGGCALIADSVPVLSHPQDVVDCSNGGFSIEGAMIEALMQAYDTNTPGVQGLLGYNNDVIVTVNSQYAGDPSPASPLMQTAHSSVGNWFNFAALALAFNAPNLPTSRDWITYSDNNVMNSSTANAVVLCWLASFTNCQSVSNPNIAQAEQHYISMATATPAYNIFAPESSKMGPSRKMFANGQQRVPPNMNERGSIVAPLAPLQLAKPYDLRLEIETGRLDTVYVTQRIIHENPHKSEIVDRASIPVQYRANGEAFIRIVPLRLGKVDLGVVGFFPNNGGVLRKVVSIVVEPGPDPRTLRAGDSSSAQVDHPVITMRLEHSVSLQPNAIYDGIVNAISIDPQFARFKVTTKDNQQIVSIDPHTGTIRAVKVGHALIQTFFGGLSTYTCVAVIEGDERKSSERTKCEELLPPGVKLRDPQ